MTHEFSPEQKATLRARNGLDFLTQKGYTKKLMNINIDTLNIASPRFCVLGQLFAEECPHNRPFDFGMRCLMLNIEQARELGFVQRRRVTYDKLTTAWKPLIVGLKLSK